MSSSLEPVSSCDQAERPPAAHSHLHHPDDDDSWAGSLDMLFSQERDTDPGSGYNAGTDGLEMAFSDVDEDHLIRPNLDENFRVRSRGERLLDAGTDSEGHQFPGTRGRKGHVLLRNRNNCILGSGHTRMNWDEDWERILTRERSTLAEEEMHSQRVGMAEGWAASTRVASAPSNTGFHGYESAMIGTETVSTLIDVEDMWTRRDDEEAAGEDPSATLHAFPEQDLREVAFNLGPEPQLPPSIFEQAAIIARQSANYDSHVEDGAERHVAPLSMAQEEELQVFYQCLANYGPWFGVTKRLSQEDMFQMSAPGAERTRRRRLRFQHS